MGLSGTLGTMCLPDLLQWLAAAAKTGVLCFTRGGISKKIFAENGEIVGSSSTDPTDFIGQWLVSCGRITEDQLRIALGEQERSSTFLGKVLIQMRALTEQELSRMLSLKTEEIIYGLFEWDEAAFEYEEGSFDPLPFRTSLRIEDVLLRGVSRYDELQRIRKIFPSSGIILQRTELAPPPELLQNSHARNILESVDGIRSIASIALNAHTSEFIASKYLCDMLGGGYLDVVPETELAFGDTADPVEDAARSAEVLHISQQEAPAERPLARASQGETGAPDSAGMGLPGAAVSSATSTMTLENPALKQPSGPPDREPAPAHPAGPSATAPGASGAVFTPAQSKPAQAAMRPAQVRQAGASAADAPRGGAASQPSRSSPAPTNSDGGIVPAGRALLEAGDYEGALQILSQAPEGGRDLRELKEKAEALFLEKIYSLHLPPDGIPILSRPLSEMTDEKLSPEESYLLSRMDGEWDICSIVSISPLREIDALRTLNALRQRGLITCKS